jgi:hypothetical protein
VSDAEPPAVGPTGPTGPTGSTESEGAVGATGIAGKPETSREPATFSRDPNVTRAVDKMTLDELLKLSGDLASVRRYDLGAVLSAVGVGLLGAALGMGEYLFRGGPLYLLIGGASALVVGLMLSRDRSENLERIRAKLDFDIDSWCRRDPEAQELRARYAKAMANPSLMGRLWRKLRGGNRP